MRQLAFGGSYLPQCIGWRDLHNVYTLESKPGEAASKSVFDAARHERFPHLHLAKDTNFARCKVCCNLKEQRLRLTGKSPDDVAAVFAKIHAHLRLQRLQRKCERVAEEQAVSHPGEQAMIYADQTAAKAIPSPWCERAFRLPVAMGGTLSRSTNTGALFVALDRFGKVDKVLTQIWLQVRQIVTSRTKACEARRLRVQTDNAGSENKNFYMIGLLALLVHWNWFDQVLHAFLLQGHTHTLDDSTNFAVSNLIPSVSPTRPQRPEEVQIACCRAAAGGAWLEDLPRRFRQALLWHLRVSCLPNRARQGHGEDSFLVQGLRLGSELAWRRWCSAQRGCPDLSRSAPG